MIGVVTPLGGKIECGRQAHPTRRKQLPKPAISCLGSSESCVLAHGPEPARVHVGVWTPGEGELARPAEITLGVTGPVIRAVDGLHKAGWETGPLARAAVRRR